MSGSIMGTYYYDWDQDDHLIQARVVNSSSDTAKTIDYRYCWTCVGNRTERIETDEYGVIIEWLRYEMEGLNHLRIDVKYDSDEDYDIDEDDSFRVQRVYYNGPGQLGQIAKVKIWDYSGQDPTSTDYYYGYDILGNISVISNSNGAEADQFEQDAFGNEVESSWSSPSGGITEHLTTKQYDADLGLYYFNARWYDSVSGGFVSRDHLNKIAYPTNRNKYISMNNYPSTYADPSGNVPIQVCCRTIGFAEAEYWLGVKHCYLNFPGDGIALKRRTLSLFPQGWSWRRGNFGPGMPALDDPSDYNARSPDCCDLCEQDIQANRNSIFSESLAYGFPMYWPLGRNSNTFVRTLLTNCNYDFTGCANISYAAGWWTKDKKDRNG